MKINRENISELTKRVTADYEKMMSAVTLCLDSDYKSYINVLSFIAPYVFNREDENRFYLFPGDESFVPVCYALLSERGYFPEEQLLSYSKLGSFLQKVPQMKRIPGFDAPCINGEGEFIIASAFAQEQLKCDNKSGVFCVLRDIEDTERICHEAERTAPLGLSGMTLILLCSSASDDEKYEKELVPELRKYGWEAYKAQPCYEQLEEAFEARFTKAEPAYIQINIF